MEAAGFENLGHAVFLAEVFAGDHLDLQAVLTGQAEDVIADLGGDGGGEAGQVAGTEAGGLHRDEQRARVGSVHQRAVEDHPVKTAEAAGRVPRRNG